MSKTEQIVNKTELENKAEPEKKAVILVTEDSEDIFALSQKNADKYFESIEKSFSKYSQAIEGLQKEWLEAYGNILKASLSLQNKFASNLGLNFDFLTAIQNTVQDTTVNLIRTRSIRDQVTLGIIDTYTQNIKAWNDNVKAFVDIGKSALQSWFSIFVIKRE